MVKEGDIFGDGVNIAARLEGLAEGDGVCVSRGVRDHLRHRANFTFEDLGEQLVKNIVHPIRAYRLRMSEVNIMPALEASPETEVRTDLPLLPDSELSADNEVSLELALWSSVKDGGPDELASYLEHYPEGTFASLARTRQSVAEADDLTTTALVKEAAEDARDAAFWDAIKESQTPEELAAYLEQHSDGHFAALARARLLKPVEALDRAGAAPGEAVELAFWESVHDTEDPRLLAAYLEKYPDGEFAVIAHARLEVLSNENQ
jgi:adenylate cyclase